MLRHFHPWTPEQGESGYSFAWLGAALHATSFDIGTICCPFGRYHPAIVAQASATLASMFPERFWLGVGTGEALNEQPLGRWQPHKERRRALMLEAVEMIRSLWRGEEVSREGLLPVDRARLFTRSHEPPLLVGAAVSKETAEWVGGWADGLLTVAAEKRTLGEIVAAFRRGGGVGKPMVVQAMVGYDADEERAWQSARDRWPIAVLEQDKLQNTATPAEFAHLSRHATVGDMKACRLRVSNDLQRHIRWIEDDLELGFERVFLHSVSPDPRCFIGMFGESVLPKIRYA